MPSASKTETILDAMVAACLNIVAGATYHTSVYDRVSRVNAASQLRKAYPYVEVFAAQARPTSQTAYDSYQLYQSELSAEVWGWAQDQSDPQGAASKIEQDIRTAIESDQTLDGTAVDVRWTGTTYSIPDLKTGVSIAVVTFSILYFVDRQDTSEGIQ